ncbi:RagB/SusD family nutrient uptake outer membrane protein [uncultured Bacteroides sp.]|uniref:RagB/SusD family nutrient uptake outer membrane protein n=1 Tax=uncultured Bacteroides sp. TaxID=162156 RepID=UPI00260C2B01|nr:RagB/SusD family nutrient uptake outer membrane protein [uncultured Bacteroides sp.]
MKLKNILSGVACTLALTSCNWDYHEYSNYGKDYVQETYDNVIGMVTNIYAMLDYDFGQTYSGGMLASACDEAEYAYVSNDICDFTNGSWSPANPMSSIWTSSFKGIQACNQYLAEFQGLTFDELKLNDDYRAQMFRYHNSFNEARFLRAYFYFNLARAYGDVPYFTEMVSTDKVNTLTRTPVQEIFNSIIEECDELYFKLPADYTKLGLDGISPAENGRVTRYAALALKARAALYAASPLFNKNNDKELWKRAAEANKAVIDTCAKYDFKLGEYTELWGPDNWTNKEMIFVRRYFVNGGDNVMEGYNFPMGVPGGKSGNCPTQNLVDAYEMKATGKLWNEPGSGYDPANPYEGRDPRFAMTIVKNGDTKWPSKNASPIETFYGGLNAEPLSGATPTGYYLKKYLDSAIDLSASSTTNKARHSWITYRLGEFYLNYAEAVFKYTESADDPSEYEMTAREAVNVIRNRVGVEMPPLPTGLSSQDFWTKYQNERMVELAFEGHRFYDLRRWKEGDKLKSITEMKLTKNPDGSITYERNVVNRTWDEKMYLFPIPQSERLKNPNLEQNPGW